jgi:hypothetical protein
MAKVPKVGDYRRLRQEGKLSKVDNVRHDDF